MFHADLTKRVRRPKGPKAISRKELHSKECSQLPSGVITLDEVDKHGRRRRAFCEICEICVRPKSAMEGLRVFREICVKQRKRDSLDLCKVRKNKQYATTLH